MTLASIPRYDPDQIVRKNERAVVVGASMAGLLAARVLADQYESVIVIDRDPLPDEPVTRRGVPQGSHPHALLESGRATIEDLFPGYGDDLVAAGGLLIDGATDVKFYSEGDFFAPGPNRIPMYFASRPLFELVARRRLAAIDGVELRAPCQFIEYLADDEAATVTGVVVRDETGHKTAFTADVVIDATGRTSRTPAWLESHGYTSPDLNEVRIDVAYSSVVVECPVDNHQVILVPPSYPRVRGGVMFPIENDRWIVNVSGMHGDHPPVDVEGMKEFAASLPTPEVSQLLDTYPLATDEVYHYPYPSNRWYRYEELTRFPDGLLVIGDAIASFNPIYGQGMSVAALEALVLHHTLAEGRDDLALRFFERVEDIVEIAWMLAVGADFAFPQTEGTKPRGTDLFGRYLSRLTRKGHKNGQLSDDFLRVLTMERPPTTLLYPKVMWRVLSPIA